MSASTVMASVMVDELIRLGVRDVVLAPGSRSAPLAIAVAAAERRGDLQLHVRIDERSAGYLALGLAKVTGLPVPVITTSGTAAVNLHPAVVEASYAGVPLLVITADRPPELRGVAANQAIDQVRLFGGDVRWSFEVGAPRREAGQVRYWRSLMSRAVAASLDPDPGPVHLNCAFSEPLVGGDDDEWVESLDGRPDGRPWTVDARARAALAEPIDELLDALGLGGVPARGAIVVGDLDDAEALDLIDELGSSLGWPVIAEPSANVSACDTAVHHGAVLLAIGSFAEAHAPDLVISVGRVGLSRSVMRFIARAGLHLAVDPRPVPHAADPTRTADVMLSSVPLAPGDVDHYDEAWLESWLSADRSAAEVIVDALAGEPLSGPAVAHEVMGAAAQGDLVFVGPSWPARHVEAFGSVTEASVIGNRGTSGIDGVMSTAWGAALAWQRDGGGRAFAIVGDLTAIYDSSGLVVPQGEARPDIAYVVVDNDGGGIFSQLEQARVEGFDRVFGTPHGRDLVEALGGLGVPVTRALDRDGLRAVLAGSGPRVVVVPTIPRHDEADLLVTIRERVSDALG